MDLKDQKDRQKTGPQIFSEIQPKVGNLPRGNIPRNPSLALYSGGIRRLLEGCGLQVTEESLDPYYVSTGIRLFLDSAYYVFHRLLHATLKINRYDTIWMVARKP